MVLQAIQVFGFNICNFIGDIYISGSSVDIFRGGNRLIYGIVFQIEPIGPNSNEGTKKEYAHIMSQLQCNLPWEKSSTGIRLEVKKTYE